MAGKADARQIGSYRDDHGHARLCLQHFLSRPFVQGPESGRVPVIGLQPGAPHHFRRDRNERGKPPAHAGENARSGPRRKIAQAARPPAFACHGQPSPVCCVNHTRQSRGAISWMHFNPYWIFFRQGFSAVNGVQGLIIALVAALLLPSWGAADRLCGGGDAGSPAG